MYYLILTTLLIIVAFVFKRIGNRNGHPGFDYFLGTILLVFLLCYLFDYMANVEGIVFGRMSMTLIGLIVNLLIPLCYVFVCQHCNVKVKTTTTFGVFSLILLNIFTSGTVYFDWQPVEHAIQMPGMHFYAKGKEVLCMEMFEVVGVIQCLWILMRTIILVGKSKQDKLKATKKGKLTFLAMFVTMTIVMIECFVPHNIRIIPAMLVFHYVLHFSIAAGLMYMVANNYLDYIIVDENEEVAYIETAPKYSVLKAKLDKIMREKKLYTDKNLSLEDVVRELNTNRTYLAEMIKESYNTSFTGYINALRVEEAKRLIKSNTASKLEEIAALSGFNTASTFTRTFKSITGVTPHMWR